MLDMSGAVHANGKQRRANVRDAACRATHLRSTQPLPFNQSRLDDEQCSQPVPLLPYSGRLGHVLSSTSMSL